MFCHSLLLKTGRVLVFLFKQFKSCKSYVPEIIISTYDVNNYWPIYM